VALPSAGPSQEARTTPFLPAVYELQLPAAAAGAADPVLAAFAADDEAEPAAAEPDDPQPATASVTASRATAQPVRGPGRRLPGWLWCIGIPFFSHGWAPIPL
jgi:hypothetical protein